MKKTINVYTPQEKMPECDTQLLIESCGQGAVIAYYIGNNVWQNDNDNEIYVTDNVDWWLNLERLNTSIGRRLMEVTWKINQGVA